MKVFEAYIMNVELFWEFLWFNLIRRNIFASDGQDCNDIPPLLRHSLMEVSAHSVFLFMDVR